ncbi:MAG: C40 family peptidase, partial [Pseudomonadota bacterium]
MICKTAHRKKSFLGNALIFCVVLVSFFPHHAGARQKPNPVKQKALPNLNNLNIQDKRLKIELEKYLGTRYMRGGTTRQGLDCSGFARVIYKNIFGVELPHNASSQFPLPMLTKIPEREFKTGDLLFFASTVKKKRINHVGIYLSDGKFIHAALNRGIVVSSLDEDHWRSRIVSGKRLTDQEMLEESADEETQDTFAYAGEGQSKSRFNIRFKDRALTYPRASFASLLDDSAVSEPEYVEYDYSRSLIRDAWD